MWEVTSSLVGVFVKESPFNKRIVQIDDDRVQIFHRVYTARHWLACAKASCRTIASFAALGNFANNLVNSCP